MGLKVGDTVPDFTLNDQYGNQFSSKDVLGKKPMVIFFYPKDNSPGCSMEACSFRDNYEEFTDIGALVVGVSADNEKSHLKFAERHNLPFTLLADTNKKVKRLFKVDNNLFVLPGRETYVINLEGKVSMVFNSVNPGQHMKRALKALKKTL